MEIAELKMPPGADFEAIKRPLADATAAWSDDELRALMTAALSILNDRARAEAAYNWQVGAAKFALGLKHT